MLTAEIMDLLDSTIVNVAGPTLAQKLGASSTDLQWIIGGYTLALGAGLVGGVEAGSARSQELIMVLIFFAIASVRSSMRAKPTAKPERAATSFSRVLIR